MSPVRPKDRFYQESRRDIFGSLPMITPTLLRAFSPDEPGARMPHAGISEGAVGRLALLL